MQDYMKQRVDKLNKTKVICMHRDGNKFKIDLKSNILK